MSTKRRIIKDLAIAAGCNKHDVKEVLSGGVLVVEEAYPGPRKDHFEVNPADGGFKRPKGFHTVLKHGKVVKSGEIW